MKSKFKNRVHFAPFREIEQLFLEADILMEIIEKLNSRFEAKFTLPSVEEIKEDIENLIKMNEQPWKIIDEIFNRTISTRYAKKAHGSMIAEEILRRKNQSLKVYEQFIYQCIDSMSK
ncbi:MAG: hypothetical protein EOP04_09565 [Proteobacteria bacterium]|nr:MAG: hypothetical protein EOP04_09565 [Pseudomonadota bacterium]